MEWRASPQAVAASEVAPECPSPSGPAVDSAPPVSDSWLQPGGGLSSSAPGAMNWIAILCLLIGLLAGWLLRRGRRQPGLLILEEMFAQKVRQADKERDQSVRELSTNRVEMRTFADRFEALDRRIAAADAELEDERKGGALAEAERE